MHNEDQHKTLCGKFFGQQREPPKMTDGGFDKRTYQRLRETERERGRNFGINVIAVRLMRETVRQQIHHHPPPPFPHLSV